MLESKMNCCFTFYSRASLTGLSYPYPGGDLSPLTTGNRPVVLKLQGHFGRCSSSGNMCARKSEPLRRKPHRPAFHVHSRLVRPDSFIVTRLFGVHDLTCTRWEVAVINRHSVSVTVLLCDVEADHTLLQGEDHSSAPQRLALGSVTRWWTS